MFYLAIAHVVQVRLPMTVLGKIFRDPFREKNMPGVAAIHHALGHVDSSSGNI